MSVKVSDVFQGKLSQCCSQQLTHYNKIWDDGVCSKCGLHSPAIVDDTKNQYEEKHHTLDINPNKRGGKNDKNN